MTIEKHYFENGEWGIIEGKMRENEELSALEKWGINKGKPRDLS